MDIDFANAKTFDLEDIEELIHGSYGACIYCGEPTCEMVEPDADGYHCESCNRPGVYGAENILIMGLVK